MSKTLTGSAAIPAGGARPAARPDRIAYPLEQLAVLIGLAAPDWEAILQDDYLAETMLLISQRNSLADDPDFLVTCAADASFSLRMVATDRISLLGHGLPGQEVLAIIDARMPRR